MALQATHVKFALDLMDKYQIKNLDHYLSGANYPDSRFLTGVGREKTHDLNNLYPLDSDFKKGWHNHLVCDLAQGAAFDLMLPDDFNARKASLVAGNDLWIRRTAIKVLQEIEIFRTFDIQPYLKSLDYVNNPNGEDLELVRKNNQTIQNIYKGKQSITIADTLNIWRGLSLSEDLVDKIQAEAEKIIIDRKIIEQVDNLYPKMLDLSAEYYQDLKICI